MMGGFLESRSVICWRVSSGRRGGLLVGELGRLCAPRPSRPSRARPSSIVLLALPDRRPGRRYSTRPSAPASRLARYHAPLVADDHRLRASALGWRACLLVPLVSSDSAGIRSAESLGRCLRAGGRHRAGAAIVVESGTHGDPEPGGRRRAATSKSTAERSTRTPPQIGGTDDVMSGHGSREIW